MPLQPKTWSRLLATVTLLVVAVSGYFFEDFKEWLPWLTASQLRTYNWISSLEARKPRAKFVTGVEIDDHTFFEVMGLSSGAVTDRRQLGEIIRTVSDFHPAVIVLDINLSHEKADDVEPRKSDNNALLLRIQELVRRNIPVILTCGFDRDTQIANIYNDDQLSGFGDSKNSYRVRVGFDHAADELRKVPLVVDRFSPGGKSRPYNSLALEAVDAYEGVLGIQQRTIDGLQRPISKREFVYTSFLRQEQFPHISASDVLQRNEEVLRKLNHRIVVIGGNRHTWFPPQGDEWLDDYYLPPLRMRGMYLQANYIEGLLDDRIRSAVPHWLASLIDLVLGASMIGLSNSRRQSIGGRLLVLGVFFIPVTLAYVASANLGYVFDFELPLTLLFLHAFADHYLHLRFPDSATKL